MRQPERCLDQDLSAPIGELLVLALARPVLLPISLRGGQDGQKRQRPAPSGPRDLRQQHEREPAQATGFNEVTVRRAYRIAVDTACLDPCSQPALDGVIQADQNRFVMGDEGVDQQTEETARQPAAGPDVTVEHAVIVGKMCDLIEPHDAQGRGDRAPARYEDRSRYQHQDMPPRGRGETGSERFHPCSQHARQVTSSRVRHSLLPESMLREQPRRRRVRCESATTSRSIQITQDSTASRQR
jgi:hypothetical protein